MKGIKGVLNLAKKINNEIGVYKSHSLIYPFIYKVLLSNGSIEMSEEVVKDYETDPLLVTETRVNKVVSSFIKSIP